MQNRRGEILAYFDCRAINAYTESLNNLIRTTNRVGRGYSFEALRAKVLLSEGPERKQRLVQLYRRMLGRDLTIETTVHEMRVPTRYEERY